MVSETDTDELTDDGRKVGVGLASCETTLGRVEKVLAVEIPVVVIKVTEQEVTEVEVVAALCVNAAFGTDDCAKVADAEVTALCEKTDVCAGKSLAVVTAVDCTNLDAAAGIKVAKVDAAVV